MQNDQLAVVIPIYNEAKNLLQLFEDWNKLFTKNGVNAQFIFINDGSTDDSIAILNSLKNNNENILILNQKNSGHGAAILNGYKVAINFNWIFQIDSDHQYDTSTFLQLWAKRNDFDFLIANRKDINASLSRKMISLICNKTVAILVGNKLSDINSPYRLIKANVLKAFLKTEKYNSFAPNVLMSAYVIKNKYLIYTEALFFRKNIVPNKSKSSLHFFKGSVQTFFKLIKHK